MSDSGLIVVVSAGNSNMPAGNFSPGSSIWALTVGATDNERKRLYFSNFGRVVDVYAPGQKTLSARSYWTLHGNNPQPDHRLNGVLDGTSMAAGYVSGLVAYLRSAHSGLNHPILVKEKIRSLGFLVDIDQEVRQKPFIWNGVPPSS